MFLRLINRSINQQYKKESKMGDCCGTEKDDTCSKKCSPCMIMGVLMVVGVLIFFGIKMFGH